MLSLRRFFEHMCAFPTVPPAFGQSYSRTPVPGPMLGGQGLGDHPQIVRN
jgi:hypothetical protein